MEILFKYPNGSEALDANIVCNDNLFHLFYKTEGEGFGIKKAIFHSLTGNDELIDKYLQATSEPVEGGCIFWLYDTDIWLLIYDIYLKEAYQFTESVDLKNFTSADRKVSFDFKPRHGTVIPTTQNELKCLNYKWEGIGSCDSISAIKNWIQMMTSTLNRTL